MPTHALYASGIPEDALRAASPSSSRQQATQGVLRQSVPQVRTIAAEPGERVVSGEFRGRFAQAMAREIEELLSSADVIGEVPLYVRDEAREWAGYYAPSEQRDAGRFDPRVDGVYRFDGVLSPVGSRRSHVRSVRVEPRAETNPFGATSTERLWLADEALAPRWVNNAQNAVADATVQATLAGEHRDFARFDVTEPSFASDSVYWLVYDLPHDLAWQTDPRVWDDYGRAKEVRGDYAGASVGTSAAVGTATVGAEWTVDPTWQRVYLSQHDYVGERVLETGRLRLEPRPDEGVLRAYQWDAAQDIYAIVQLGNTAWHLDDWDVQRIGLERIQSLTRWTDDSSTFELVAELRRGSDVVQFYEPENASGSTPADLVTRLDPIASESDQVLGESQSVMERTEVPDE